MPKDLKQQSDTYWRNEAGSFDRHYRSNLLSLSFITKTFLKKRTDLIVSLLQYTKKEDLIDIGCGSGIQLAQLENKFSDGVIGVDYSFDMLSLCQQNLPKTPYKHRFLINADAEKLCFQNSRFNCLISLGLLDYMPDYRLVLKEFYRILKPQGKILFTIPKKPSIFFFFRTRIGINLRKMLFNLPPILTAVTQKELLSTLEHLNFKLEFIDSLWNTMWIVKVKKA